MATISVGPGSYIRPYRKPRVRHFLVGASQTILKGDPLILSATADAGNKVTIAGADPTADYHLVGFAAEAITTGSTVTAADKIPVWLATPDAEFVVHYADTQALDVDDIGTAYGIVADGTNDIWRLDDTETTAPVFMVIDLLDAHADVNGRAVVQVLAPERLYGTSRDLDVS